MKTTIAGITFALALMCMALATPKVAKADTVTCDSSATSDSSGNWTEPNGSACVDPDPMGGIGD